MRLPLVWRVLAVVLAMASTVRSQPYVIISEIMADPSAVDDGAGEWFEVFNPNPHAVDLNGWTIKSYNESELHVIDNGGPLLIPASGYALFGTNGDPLANGGVAIDYVYSAITLVNSADLLELYDPSQQLIDSVGYGLPFPVHAGKSMELMSHLQDNNTGSNWNAAVTAFGAGDLGTPGRANSQYDPGSGDFDQDGDADGDDFLAWQRNVGASGILYRAQGDASGDHLVNGWDLAVWQQQFGPVAPPAAPVPEPAASLVCALAVACAALHSPRRRRAQPLRSPRQPSR